MTYILDFGVRKYSSLLNLYQSSCAELVGEFTLFMDMNFGKIYIHRFRNMVVSVLQFMNSIGSFLWLIFYMWRWICVYSLLTLTGMYVKLYLWNIIFPAVTQREKKVHLTSITSTKRWMDVETTFSASWVCSLCKLIDTYAWLTGLLTWN